MRVFPRGGHHGRGAAQLLMLFIAAVAPACCSRSTPTLGTPTLWTLTAGRVFRLKGKGDPGKG